MLADNSNELESKSPGNSLVILNLVIISPVICLVVLGCNVERKLIVG